MSPEAWVKLIRDFARRDIDGDARGVDALAVYLSGLERSADERIDLRFRVSIPVSTAAPAEAD